MPLGPTTKTVQDVFNRVKRQFGDESGAQITDSDIIGWINSAQVEINKISKILKGVATTPTVVATREYSFPDVNVLNVEWLQYNGRPLEYVQFADVQDKIAKDDPLFELTSNNPYMWWEWGNQIFLYPTPTEVGTLTLYYIAYPAEVTLSTDTLSLPDSYFDMILQHVLAQAYEQDDDWNASAAKQAQLKQSLTDMADDGEGYDRGYYPTITVLEDYY